MKLNRRVIVMGFVLWGVCGAPLLYAGTSTSGDYLVDIGTKFVRGLGNILQSPIEPICGIRNETRKRPIAGVFTGLGKGTVSMLYRLLVGVDEVATFVIPMEATLPPVCQVEN